MLERFHSLAIKYPLDIITYFSILIPILVGVARYSYLKREIRLVLLFFCVEFSAESVALFSILNGGTTLHIPDIRASLDIVLVAVIYYVALVRAIQKKLLAAVGSIFLLFSLILYSGDSVAPWSSTAFRVYAMGATLTYYNAILADLNLKKIQHHSMFWFTAGLLFYVAGTFFTMLFNQYLFDKSTSDAVFDLYINLSQVLYIIFCLLASIGFWVSFHDRNNYFERNYMGNSNY